MNATPVRAQPAGALPKDVEERLATLTFTEQFAALRAIEAATRADGESPERLGGVIRGYANLGVLTEFHWNPAHDVFKARALLAAQGWVARAPRSSDALRHRAYAYALAGLHRFALDDLAAAKAVPAGPGERSTWAPLLEAYCRFDTQALLDAKPGPDRALAMLLAFLTVEGGWSTARTVEIGRALLRENPECYRVHDGLCSTGGVSVLHEATSAPMAVYASEVPRRLQAMADLPPGIVAQLDAPVNEVPAAKALVAEGRTSDRGEPSWAVLGGLMDETRFVHVWRRADFLAYRLGVPAGDFVQEALRMVADHPYRTLIESYGVDRVRDSERFQFLLRSVKRPDVDAEITELSFFFDTLSSTDPAASQEFFKEASLREDSAEHDLKLFLRRVAEGEQARNAKFLLDVSPHSPMARAYLIERSWPEVEAKAREWEAEGAPQILIALGRRYITLKRWDDAERCLKRGLTMAPDKTNYELLADLYRMQGDWKGWQGALDQFLARGEDYGLDRAQIQMKVANHLMDERRWKDAEPYAEGAAQSWASFGMDCARRCYEGLEDWDKAELWVQRQAERYPDQAWAAWYLFCLRTGHGDVEAARSFTARYIESVGQRATGPQRIAFGCFHLMNGQKPEALAMFRGCDGEVLAPGVLFAALTADALGDAKLRDRYLEQLTTDPQCTAQAPSLPIYRMYRAALADGRAAELDLQAVDKQIAAMPEGNRGNAEFHVGWFLALHGAPEKAAQYLERCAEGKSAFYWYQYVAKAARKDPQGVLGKAS